MRDEKVPDVLYKYYPPERWENMFKDWTIRFTPIIEFNDPFEAWPHFESLVDDKFLRVGAQALGIPVLEQDEFRKFATKEEKEYLLTETRKSLGILGVLSLALGRRNLLMWSHYAQSHKGFVVGFDMNSSLFKECLFPARKVKYTSKRPSMKSISDIILTNDFTKILYTKGNFWKYENEYRTIGLINSSILRTFQNKKGICDISPQEVCTVIFGTSMPSTEIKEKCIFIRSQPECAHIKLQRARLHESRYELLIKDIEPDFYKT